MSERSFELTAYAVINEAGQIDPLSVRAKITTCETYAYVNDLALRGTYSIVPVKIVHDSRCEVDELIN